MSEFKVEVVQIGEIEKHPNADRLGIVQVHGGYPCIVALGDFSPGDLAAYVPVDALVPTNRPEFDFLSKEANANGFYRIRARKLRGIFSMGLLVRAPTNVKVGDDCQALLGVEKWLPPAEREPAEPRPRKSSNGRICHALAVAWVSVKRFFGFAPPKPPSDVPVYDIEGYRKHKHLFQEGEPVSITEKIHGANCRFVHDGKHLWVGSRTTWKKAPSVWHEVAERYRLADVLRQYPGAILFGEVYGNVQDLKYGKGAGVDFVAFDLLWTDRRFGAKAYRDVDDFQRFCMSHMIPTVPELYRGPWHPDLIVMAEGNTTITGAHHVREGIVIKPLKERSDHHFGRVFLKLAGEGYLTRKETNQ